MAIENSITFGGVNSADFGIYISGEGVFNAPERDVEMIEIPGRSGDLVLDKGRYLNIEVKYPAFNYEEDYATFAKNLSDFRNAICSQKGYQRLSDTFHPNEYRMATYISGIEIEPIKYNTASEFELVFNCKPQRYLTSGETAASVESGDVLTNPTLFESGPLLEVTGYGNITMNGYEISITNESYGDVVIRPADDGSEARGWSKSFTFDAGMANTGDTISCQSFGVRFYPRGEISSYTETVVGSGFTHSFTRVIDTRIGIGSNDFSAGTAEVKEYTVNAVLTDSSTITLTIGIEYDGHRTFTMYFEPSEGYSLYTPLNRYNISRFILHSTAQVVDPFVYLDCDLGEAYKIFNGEYTSLNRYIDLGSDLPVLSPGANTITFDNTVTDLKITPRWWKI